MKRDSETPTTIKPRSIIAVKRPVRSVSDQREIDQGRAMSIGDAGLLDFVGDSVVVRNLDGRVLAWNKASEELYGFTRAQALNQLVDSLLETQYPAPVSEIMQAALNEGRWRGQTTRVNSQGLTLTIETHWAVRNVSDGAIEVIETGRVVDTPNFAADARRHRQRCLRNLFEALSVSTWEIDVSAAREMVRRRSLSGADLNLATYLRANPAFVRDLMRATRIVDVNDQAVKLFGRGEKDELLTNVVPFWPPESSGAYEAAIIAALAGRPSHSAEVKMSRIDGSLFDALFTIGCPSDSTHPGTLMVGILDVTASKQASYNELRYRNLFHYLPIALWQMNTRGLSKMFADLRRQGVEDLGKYIDEHPEWVLRASESVVVDEVNQSTADLLGVKDSRELLGPLKTRRINPAGLRPMLEARYRGTSYFQEETKMVTQDGKVVDGLFFVASPQPLTDIGVSLVGFLDLSERVKAQEMLNNVQAEFAHAARISVLGELTASIAHEVNQPLGAIATNGDAGLRWLNRTEPNIAEASDLMARIVADARRAAEVISRIRGLAMRHAPERVVLSLDDVVQETLLVLSCEIKARGVSVTADLTQGNTRVVGDRTQLQQVIMNLTVNALQAMSERQNGRRELLIHTAIDEGGHACCGVEDSGPGIPAEAIGRLFESFFTTKPSGMGMGLPICRSIVEAHGGRIFADNNSARGGARFLLNLPPAPAEA